MSTLKDVAREASVSIATVSHYLNKTKPLRPETEKAVREAIAKTHYKYNAQAAGLKRASTALKTLGLISVVDENPFFQELFFAIEKEASAHGIAVLSSFLHADVHQGLKEDFHKSFDLLANSVDVLLVSGIDGEPLARLLNAKGELCTVLFAVNNAQSAFEYGIDWQQNGYLGGLLTARHLLSLGCRSFAVFTGPLSITTVQDRLRGLKEVLAKAGLGESALTLYEGDFSYTSGQELLQKMTLDHVAADAVICHNDLMAAGALNMALRLGLKVPQDLRITGYDGIVLGALLTPALTTVEIDLDDLARKLIESCKKAYLHEAGSSFTIESYPKLCIRGSA